MKVFKDCVNYDDYVRVIGNGLTSETFEFKHFQCAHMWGFDALRNMEEKRKSKVIEVLKYVDAKGTETPNKNEINKKETSFLKVGLFAKNYPAIFDSMSVDDLNFLITEGLSYCDERDLNYVAIFAHHDLLDEIRKDNFPGNLFFGITQWYDNNPFDITSIKKTSKFVNDMIKRIKTDTLFDENVLTLSQYGEKVMLEIAQK